jgi:hypothetical protein
MRGRRWFGNTRVIDPKELDKFREEMRVKAADPYSVILRSCLAAMLQLLHTHTRARANTQRMVHPLTLAVLFPPASQAKETTDGTACRVEQDARGWEQVAAAGGRKL